MQHIDQDLAPLVTICILLLILNPLFRKRNFNQDIKNMWLMIKTEQAIKRNRTLYRPCNKQSS